MAQTNPSKFDHLVVLMFENRSFDNLLGYLYEDDEPKRWVGRGEPIYRGLSGRDGLPLCNEYLGRSACAGPAPYATPSDMSQPDPDPGEEYQHIYRQLYGFEDLRDRTLPDTAPMSGFLEDYARVLEAAHEKFDLNRGTRDDDPARIMNCFPPQAVPVMSELGRQFGVSDEWFASVPTQTLPNRSFLASAQSNGWVNNAPYLKWARNTRTTVFERLTEKLGRGSWRVYWEPQDFFSVTRHLHTQLLSPRWCRNFRRMDRFREDCRKGRLPAYTVIEPRLFFDHNDMHPPPYKAPPNASSILGGEILLAEVYRALRDSPIWNRTLLVVLFDEHGGCYDHWPPPKGATPPYPPESPLRHHRPPEQDPFGFEFDRFGVRVPAIFISPYVDRGTVIRSAGDVPFDHTSVIKTLCNRWGLEPLTDRDRAAPDFSDVLSLDVPRADRPEVQPRPYAGAAGWEETALHALQAGLLELVSRVHGRSVDPSGHSTTSALDHLRKVRRTRWLAFLKRTLGLDR